MENIEREYENLMSWEKEAFLKKHLKDISYDASECTAESILRTFKDDIRVLLHAVPYDVMTDFLRNSIYEQDIINNYIANN